MHILCLREDVWRSFVIAAVACVILFAFMVVTFYFPNSWEYFTAARIAKNARLQITQNATLCGNDWQHFTCPEVGWAVFFTTEARISTNLVLKMYPGNVFFLTYLMSLVVFCTVIRAHKKGRLLLKRHVVWGFTFGELVVGAATLAMVSAFFFYWLHDHNYNGYWAGGFDRGLTDSERWARGLGQLAVMFMSLLFFPASRNSAMHRLFGTSWEASLWAHRFLGYCMLAASFGHMVAWYVKYGEAGFFPKDVFEIPMSLPSSIDNFTVPMNTLTTWLLFVCMGVFALDPLRRRFFELFYYSHLVATYIAIPAVLWHAAASWEYLLPGVTVWFVDRLVRMYRSASVVKLLSIRACADVTELRWLQPTMVVAPGQYVFVNVAELSLFEWHPFTVSSSIDAECFALHIKAMGPGTWTERLLQLAMRGNASASLAVDGPYGHPIQFADYSRVLLIAGGIGITPCASIYSALKSQESIDVALIWSVRDARLLDAVKGQLQVAPTAPSSTSASVKVFITRGSEQMPEIHGVITARGRPSWARELEEIGSDVAAASVLVFACGPEELVAEVRRLAVPKGFHFHRETFLL